MQSLSLLVCHVDLVRYYAPQWNNSTLLEALRKIRETWKSHADVMPEPEILLLLRKESILRGELLKRMRKKGIGKREAEKMQEKLIGHRTGESAFKR